MGKLIALGVTADEGVGVVMAFRPSAKGGNSGTANVFVIGARHGELIV